MNVLRLRTLTTGILHTEIGHVYDDIEYITGYRPLTHEIPHCLKAMKPFLEEQKLPEHFWDGQFIVSHEGEIDIREMNEFETESFLNRFTRESGEYLEAISNKVIHVKF